VASKDTTKRLLTSIAKQLFWVEERTIYHFMSVEITTFARKYQVVT
jgi:hypothetical protein